MLTYSLEIELRLYTILFLLTAIEKNNFNRNEVCERIRGLAEAKKIVVRDGIEVEMEYQNIIYFGIERYIEKIINKYGSNEISEIKIKGIENILDKVYGIVAAMDVIKNTILHKLKEKHENDYQQLIQKIYMTLYNNFDSKQKIYIKKILEYNKYIIDKYINIDELTNIGLANFIRIYRSDDIKKNGKENI